MRWRCQANVANGGAHVKHESGRTCFDGVDNDGDGGVDCDDPDCRTDPRAKLHCAKTETGKECFDGIDNDGDGRTDCQDIDCINDPSWKGKVQAACTETGKECFDGIDNDKDGKAVSIVHSFGMRDLGS